MHYQNNRTTNICNKLKNLQTPYQMIVLNPYNIKYLQRKEACQILVTANIGLDNNIT